MTPRAFFVLTFAGTALLAACGGGSTTSVTPTPSATATPTPSATATPTPSATATPTPTSSPGSGGSTASAFTGGNHSVSCTSTGCPANSMTGADGGYTVTATFGANDATAGFSTAMYWATFNQITPPFAPGALPSTIGTAFIYLDFVANTTVNFTATPALQVTTTGSFSGSHCGFAFYGNTGGGTGGTPTWNSMTAVGLSEVTPTGTTLSIPAGSLPPGNTVKFSANTDQFIALYCH